MPYSNVKQSQQVNHSETDEVFLRLRRSLPALRCICLEVLFRGKTEQKQN